MKGALLTPNNVFGNAICNFPSLYEIGVKFNSIGLKTDSIHTIRNPRQDMYRGRF